MANIFKSIPKPRLKRNTFNMSHDVKLTTEFGRLTPIFIAPVVPGDTFNMNTEILIRVAPLLAPVMHRVNVYTHFFFVPWRLLWDNFQKFITGGETGTEEPAYPKLAITDAVENPLLHSSSLMDYFGFPTFDNLQNNSDIGKSIPVFAIDALPFKAYQLIWNEYYRDENLQDEINIHKWQDGLNTAVTSVNELLTIRYRSWEKDYFTSALPWTQRGEETTIGLSGNADVIAQLPDAEHLNRIPYYTDSEGNNLSDNSITRMNIVGGKTRLQTSADPTPAFYNPNGSLVADLSTVNATTINELRRAIQLQQYKELLARSGSRYIELIRGLFGVVSSDARLQRPEFLGGGKTELPFGEVLQTSSSTEDSPLANYAGRGVAYGKTHSFKRFFEEHGYVIGIMSIMPKPGYFQGLPRMFYKFDRLDHYIPQFANIGEQEILNQELFYNFENPDEVNSGVFGYTPRYAEYKYMPNRVAGDFKGNLDFWHMAREFNDTPHLNSSFIQMKPDEVSRVYAVTDTNDDHLWCMIYHNLKATRPMPKFGVPLI